MHHGIVMSGSPTRDGGENIPGIRGACATGNITYLAWSMERKQGSIRSIYSAHKPIMIDTLDFRVLVVNGKDIGYHTRQFE